MEPQVGGRAEAWGLEGALREALRREVSNQLDPLRADLEALRETFGAVASLAPALRVLAAVPAALGLPFDGVGRAGGRRRGEPLEAPALALRAAALSAGAQEERGCAVEGCKRPHRSRGYCGAHYQQRRLLAATGRLPPTWVEDAAPQSVPPVRLQRGGVRRGPAAQAARSASASAERGCAVVGCVRPHRSRGYCGAHYQQRRLMEGSHRLPPEWVEDAAPQSVQPVALPRGRRPRDAAPGPSSAAAPEPSKAPRAWVVKKRGDGAAARVPLVPGGRAATSAAQA